MKNNQLLALLSLIGVLLILTGNVVFQDKTWIDLFWDITDLYTGILLLVLAYWFWKS